VKRPEQLPLDLVWTAEGHLSDVAMTTIADGEEAILPRDAFGHLGLCEVCAAGVESAAALSASVSRALTAPAETPHAPEVKLRFPIWAAAMTAAVAAVATLPNLGAMRAWPGRMWWVLSEGAPMLTRHAVTFLPRAWNWLPVMSLTAAMLLLLAGLSVARLAPRAIER
jgi:hypothetical protein